MVNDEKITYTAMSFPEVLAIVFVVLKLCGVITWSWWWVFAPIWICWGVVILVIVVLAILYLIRKFGRKRKRC